MMSKITDHKFVSQRGLENLRSYSYSGVDKSLTARLFLNDFWNWVVSKVPMWIAPNILTLCGFMFILAAAAICAWYAPTFREPLPTWALVASAVLIFLYQTADNIDGKQAKRCKAGSPLGELFDHGVDSVVMGLVTMILGSTFRAGPMLTILGSVVCLAPFYFAHWEEYHAGTLILGELTGPTELQHVVMSVLLASAAFGTDIWLHEIKVISVLRVNVLLFLVIIVGSSLVCLQYASSVRHLTTTGTAVTRQTFAEASKQPIAYGIFTGVVLIWTFTTSEVASRYPQAYMFATSCIFGYITQRLIVQRICKEHFRPMYSVQVPFFLAAANGLINTLNCECAINPVIVLIFVLAYSVLAEAFFAVSIVRQLTTFLKIRAFKIPFPPPL